MAAAYYINQAHLSSSESVAAAVFGWIFTSMGYYALLQVRPACRLPLRLLLHLVVVTATLCYCGVWCDCRPVLPVLPFQLVGLGGVLGTGSPLG